MFPLGFLEMKLIGQWIQGSYWPVARVCNVPVRETVKEMKLWLQALANIKHTHRTRQTRNMADGLGASGVEECKGFSRTSVPTTNVAANKNPLVSNTPFTADVRY